jgi:hypothetical protein
MSLELVNTFGTLFTALVIAATAIAALVQLRHLRAGNQINAMLSIGNQFDAKEFREALDLVNDELGDAMNDPGFRDYLSPDSNDRELPPETLQRYRRLFGAARLVANTYEELGILVKNDVVERELFLDRYGWVIWRGWLRMRRMIGWARKLFVDDAIWENFELMAVYSQDYMRKHESLYPPGVRRLDTDCPWEAPVRPHHRETRADEAKTIDPA